MSTATEISVTEKNGFGLFGAYWQCLSRRLTTPNASSSIVSGWRSRLPTP